MSQLQEYKHYYAVIMAGGGGTRLWPLSRQAYPKQMLQLVDEYSLFQTSVRRLEGLFPPERIFIVTVQEQSNSLRSQCPEIPEENYLLEPMPRGTASVVGLAAVALHHLDPEAVMAILTSDHVILNEERYRQCLRSAYEAARSGYLATLGITPTHSSTGYGYIQRGEKIGVFSTMDVFRVKRFKEKPAEEQARAMLETGDHSWNSGMFIWQVGNIQAEFVRQMPDLWRKLEIISVSWKNNDRQKVLEDIWPKLKVETIDYGIMEGAQNVAVIPVSDLGWNDVGSWESLFEVLPADAQGNIVRGVEHIGMDTRRSLVFSNQEDRLVVTIGVEDLVIIDTGDILLVCHKDKAQHVRQVVNQIKETHPEYQ